ncbi:hydrogen peroxide-inducible genes activator [Spongiibacter sp. KMU-158]|uniref:Hydrogen peroxide-inducible genes activator n=1 Tax=Spongiibacter pelagi TaxID=2760804 RepID=A0A927C0B1_9GAMM|nr:hydrogen peroxide-inducible genes activator [Spongiibacter pelagi]MBD2857532.1 hydrogen peroxide-inducible genes activator [Spongiibacter pelagi]
MFLKSEAISLKQLQYFEAVASLENFRRAADQLGISQPALTTQIAALEEKLGLQLFERSRSGTLLSPAGRELLPHARQVLLKLNTFIEAADMLGETHQITYRLGVPPTVGPYLLPNVLPGLHQRYQKLKLYVREDGPTAIQRDLLMGSYDFAILPLPVSSDDLVVEPLFTEPLKLVVSSENPLAGLPLVPPGKLRAERILTLQEHHHFHHQVKDICSRVGAELLSDYEGTSLDTLRQMVVMGMGSAFLPGLYVHSEMHKPEALWVTEVEGLPIRRQHALVWRAGAPNRIFFRELAASLKEMIEARLGKVVMV